MNGASSEGGVLLGGRALRVTLAAVIDDLTLSTPSERSGVRLHLGGVSHGCVTVSKCQPDADKKWKEIRDMINSTKKEKLKFIKGPHWWNPWGETTKYGTITIK